MWGVQLQRDLGPSSGAVDVTAIAAPGWPDREVFLTKVPKENFRIMIVRDYVL